MDYNYYIIHLNKELPHPSFPRVICVPKSWIKFTFEGNKVAVELPREDYAITATRIRSEDPGDNWPLCWAVIKDKKSQHVSIPSGDLHQGECESRHPDSNSHDFETAIINARVYNEVVMGDQPSQQSGEASGNTRPQLEENQPRNTVTDEISEETRKQNKTEQSLEKSAQQNMSESEKVPDEKNSEENLVESEQQDIANEGENHSKDQMNSEEKCIEIDSEEDEVTSVEDIRSESSDQSWKPNSTHQNEEHSSISIEFLSSGSEHRSEGNPQRRVKKTKKRNKRNTEKPLQRKRATEEINNTVNVKKRKVENLPHSKNEDIPSASQSTLSSFKTKRKTMSRRKFMKNLALKYKQLEENLIQLDDVLELMGANLNKITELFVEAIYIVTLLIDDENIDDNSYLQENAVQNSGHRRFQKRRSESNIDDEVPYNLESENTIQPQPDAMDKRSKWTLRHEERKPQPGLVELLPGCGIYISETGMQQCKEIPDNCPTRLARHLLTEIFSDDALRKCTLLGGKSSKPGLDDYARRQLINFVKMFSCEEGWEIDEKFEKSIYSSLGKKLWEIVQETN